jgi:UDP-N-acetylglucosamine 1-carboxyvinyltransferase
MDKFVIQGGRKLSGEVSTSGAKNAVLPLMFATLLVDGEHVFHNVPRLQDVDSAALLLKALNAEVTRDGSSLRINVKKTPSFEAHYDIVRKMRASILCLGPLLARYGQAVVSMPGGCAIGTRPIDQHLDALQALGAEITTEGGYVHAKAKKLVGSSIVFDGVTVGGTENALMAAVLAEGKTTIENAAKEPEIVDLADYLIKMGGKIKGAGTSVIEVTGVSQLRPAEHSVIPDRIEAGTLLIAGAITGGQVTVKTCRSKHIESLILKMKDAGIRIESTDTEVTTFPHSGFQAVDIMTAPFPGFATDLQAQYMALMTQAEGTSVISETIFENRFMHVQELMRLNAQIVPKTRVAVVRGVPGGLVGAPVMATDLRASASLVLAALCAEGETVISRIYHLDRGYDQMVEKMRALGAEIERQK